MGAALFLWGPRRVCMPIVWRLTASALFGILAAACASTGDDGASPPNTEPFAPTSSPPATASAPPSSAVMDWREYPTDAGPGRYVDDGYFCCAEGEGRDCCSIYSGDRQCLNHGGLYEVCVGEGAEYDARFPCVLCCEELAGVSAYFPADDGLTCTEGVPSAKVCTRCGDGACGVGENWCNCSADCTQALP